MFREIARALGLLPAKRKKQRPVRRADAQRRRAREIAAERAEERVAKRRKLDAECEKLISLLVDRTVKLLGRLMHDEVLSVRVLIDCHDCSLLKMETRHWRGYAARLVHEGYTVSAPGVEIDLHERHPTRIQGYNITTDTPCGPESHHALCRKGPMPRRRKQDFLPTDAFYIDRPLYYVYDVSL
jgi:hypothetical protein